MHYHGPIMSIKDERLPFRIVITDSGLGGLSICADLEKSLRNAIADRPIELIYVNAWPDPGWGYNDLPDPAARARVLDKALARMAGYRPDLILIACNTLSVLYDLTEFRRDPPVPVRGIINEGVELFVESLAEHPESGLLLFGTRTTIESGEHVRRLIARGIAPGRLAGAACHRLAAVIDDDPESPAVAEMIEKCVPGSLPEMGPGATLYAGLVCTHYGYVRDVFHATLVRKTGRTIEILDPNVRLVESLAAELAKSCPRGAGERTAELPPTTVEVISKIELGEAKRRAIARKIEPVSPRTARALIAATWTPDLF
jgi:glutamate racemase